MKLQMVWENLQALYCRYFGRSYPCGCGHITKWKTALTIHGRSGVFTVRSKNPDYCPQCWAKSAIRCAWCGEPILPGDPVTLYRPGPRAGLIVSTKEPSEARKRREGEGFVVPESAVVYREDPLTLVGCLGWNCADTGADRAGFWVMPGRVQRVMTPFEEVIAGGGSDPLIIRDLTDPRKATPTPDEEI